MSLSTVRNYLAEKYQHLKQEWRNYQRSDYSTGLPSIDADDEDLRRDLLRARNPHDEYIKTDEYKHNAQQTLESIKQQDIDKHEPFEFYTPLSDDTIPHNRRPHPGIIQLPYYYHSTNPVYTTEDLPETGFRIHPIIDYLITNKYPRYRKYIEKYVRPLGTTDATFTDFNREQKDIAAIPEDRKTQVLQHVKRFLNAQKYLPLHFVDFQYASLPLHTGTGYHQRHNYKLRTHAKYAHHKDYHQKPTSKGYYLNSFLQIARTQVHHIKEFCLPFNPTNLSPTKIIEHLKHFLLSHPTILFTRNHISDRDGALKQRPVYAVDDLFLCLEVMLTFPLLVMARKMDCCIMYGLETIRGGNHYLDWLAKKYKSYFTIDWSSFDQRLPRVITDIYYTDFLESLIVISHGYQPTWEYMVYPDLTAEKLFYRVTNMLHFLHTWYNNMVFLTADGYAYLRTTAGVPSGLFNTQYLDSFGNLFLIIDGFIEFGFTDIEIEQITLFIMGDDNSGFTTWQIGLLEKFISWFESYAFDRYNMVLSKTKSIITTMRNRIETLSYTCNFGMPTRPLPKLVAQLCYPEHGPNDKYMSARAIGIAYAAAGMDPTFHKFCEDLYYSFLPYAAPMTKDTMERISKHLPGQFKMLDAYFETIDLTKFPTLHQVREIYSYWHGPLDFQPKWNKAHFVSDPDKIPPSAMTVAEYRQLHNIRRPPVISVFEA
uniref:Putative RNA-dependent RNA polymerase n=1 Tax=Lichen partiti-like RNA virus sp. TaxID=2726938 RepID=A0A6J4CWJ7_9VIRU|nr:putative RNA-dependent RNA polymerase [Lichen partiti-like RNA virus sp.]